MNCPTHKAELKETPITKGSKVIGRNFFCPNMECDYEIDKPLEKKRRH